MSDQPWFSAGSVRGGGRMWQNVDILGLLGWGDLVAVLPWLEERERLTSRLELPHCDCRPSECRRSSGPPGTQSSQEPRDARESRLNIHFKFTKY